MLDTISVCLLFFALVALGYCAGRMHADHLVGLKPLPWRTDIQPVYKSAILGDSWRLYEFPCGHSVAISDNMLGGYFVRAWAPGVHGPVYATDTDNGSGTIRGEHSALCARGTPSPWKWVKS